MADRLPALLPRIAAIVLLGLALTASLTYAAGRAPSAATPRVAARAAKPAPLVVPDVRSQAFVFAKGALEDAGFAWRVDGSVHGYASNMVVGESPAPGTKLVDTGSPLVVLTLRRASGYAETGQAEDVSPYPATAVQSAELASTLGPAAPAVTMQTATTAAPAFPAVASAKKAVHTAPATRWPQHRPPAFTVPGGRTEPLNEMPLTNRAQALRTWLESHRQRTPANVAHWLYQNEWIVAGAKFGWWHGAQALTTLITIDRLTQKLWGVGSQSASLAQNALGEVQSRSK